MNLIDKSFKITKSMKKQLQIKSPCFKFHTFLFIIIIIIIDIIQNYVLHKIKESNCKCTTRLCLHIKTDEHEDD